MAIFIASTKSISRGKGQSAVACASYRAGVELEDKRYGKTHDYSKRHGVMSADIILPTKLAVTGAVIDRSTLWNRAEAAEKRKDARVAREWLVNLPHELSEADRRTIAHKFAQALADRYGTIADCAIHKPTQKEIDRGADPRNYHAHILLTTRCAQIDDNFEIILTDKATIELSDNHRRKLGLERVSVEIKEVRELWEQIANEKLFEHHQPLIDSRSYRDQGIDIIPQVKMGVDATHLERRTGETSIRGDLNRLIATRNELVWNTHLSANQKINDLADKTLADLRQQKLFSVPTAPNTALKASDVPKTELTSAQDTLERLKIARLNREHAQKEEQERLRQQQIAADKRKAEAQLKQEQLERQQRQERARIKIAKETQQFNQHYEQLKRQQIGADPSILAPNSKNSTFSDNIYALKATDKLMKALLDYQEYPSTTDHQKTLSALKYEQLASAFIKQSEMTLNHIKNTRHRMTQKTQTTELQRVLDDMVVNHLPTLCKTQLTSLQSVLAATNEHSHQINRSRGLDLGF